MGVVIFDGSGFAYFLSVNPTNASHPPPVPHAPRVAAMRLLAGYCPDLAAL